MAAALDNSSFIIKPRYQSVFWCRQGLILHNYEMLYLLHKMLSSQQKHLKKKKITMESLFLPLSSHYVFLTLLISVVVVVFKLVFSILSHI